MKLFRLQWSTHNASKKTFACRACCCKTCGLHETSDSSFVVGLFSKQRLLKRIFAVCVGMAGYFRKTQCVSNKSAVCCGINSGGYGKLWFPAGCYTLCEFSFLCLLWSENEPPRLLHDSYLRNFGQKEQEVFRDQQGHDEAHPSAPHKARGSVRWPQVQVCAPGSPVT